MVGTRTDFFERQEWARRRTRWLVFLFLLAVVLIIIAVYFAALLASVGIEHYLKEHEVLEQVPPFQWWNPRLFGIVFWFTILVIGIGSFLKMLDLREGGKVIAERLGGRLVSPNTQDLKERRLLNVVEEMALASGIPVPQVYILDREKGINAFAAGFSPSDAVIGVTRGCVELLSRDELQGVIAHEFSHILYGDMRLNLRLIGLVHGILGLSLVGYTLVRVGLLGGTGDDGDSDSRSRGGTSQLMVPLLVFGAALMAIGYIGWIFSRLIKSSVSRQREYLADAAAVQFTRNPGGIVGALKKIGGLVYGSRLFTPRAEEASHMYFGNGLREAWFRMFATHPPLVDRIRVWEPEFDGRFPEVKVTFEVEEDKIWRREVFGEGAKRRRMLGAAIGAAVIGAGEVTQNVGQIHRPQLLAASLMIEEIPKEVREAVRDPLGAMATVFALLFAHESSLRPEDFLRDGPKGLLKEVQRLLMPVKLIRPVARLPLVGLAISSLRNLSPAQFEQFETLLNRVIEADESIDLFEYALLRIIQRHLEPHFRKVRRQAVQYYALRPLLKDCAVVLSCLAYLGGASEQEAQRAFATGWSRLGKEAAEHPETLLPASAAGLPEVDQALQRLRTLAFPLRKQVLEACAWTVSADGQLKEREAELLRAIADTLECPVPPFLQFVSVKQEESSSSPEAAISQ